MIVVLAGFLTAPALTYGFDDWLSLRDRGVVRQHRDYSCGAAALATLLTYYYRHPVSEASLINEALARRDSKRDSEILTKGLSFSDMAMLAKSRGYSTVGLDVGYRDLQKLTMPVIVAMEIYGRAHFSVLRKIDRQNRVFLADPSWGNRQLTSLEFRQSLRIDGEGVKARILIVGSERPGDGNEAFRHPFPRRVLMAPRR